MRVKLIIIALLCATILVGCCSACRQRQKNAKPLKGTEWHLVQLEGKDMELPIKEMEETLSVDAENTSNIEVSGVETDNCTEPVSQIYSGTMQQIENVDVETIEVANEHPLYILVIGSLPSLSQAQKQIVNFYDAGINQEIKIYEAGGKYRLYIDGYDMMSQAQSKLDALLAQPDAPFAGVWICSTRK
jgi:hypothetical protein